MATADVLAASREKRLSARAVILRRIFSFPVLLGVLLVAGSFVATMSWERAPARMFIEGDTWWHVATGNYILATGTWPTSDPYSYTVAGNHWIAYEWLGEVMMALVERWGGLPALMALLAGWAAAILLLMYRLACLRSRNPKAAFAACALLLPAIAPVWTLRPQLLGYVFLLLTLICLEQFRQGRRKFLWVLPPLLLVWVNTHGTFVFALFLIGLCWASSLCRFRLGAVVAEPWPLRERRRLLLVLLLCVLVLPITPYGTRLAAYPWEMAVLQPVNIANIFEWQPMPFDIPFGKYFLVVLLVFFLVQFLSRQEFRPDELAFLFLTVYLASLHRRFILLFVVAFAPLLAKLLARWFPPYQPAKDRPALNVVLIGLVLAGTVVFFPSRPALEKAFAKQFPVAALAFIQENQVSGPLLNEYHWGGYLLWKLYPQRSVFIDGRADIYEYGGVLSDYLHITGLKSDTLFLLRKYGIQACLLERTASLSTFLAASPDWEQAYVDELSVVFVHKSARSQFLRAAEVVAKPKPAGTFQQ